MKRIAVWVMAAAGFVFVIDWGVVGVKILNGDYDIAAGAYVGLACIIALLGGAVCWRLGNRCPHCGKLRQPFGEYCPYCGKKIK